MLRPRRFTPYRRAVQALVALFYLGLPLVNHLGFRSVAGNLASLKLGPFDLAEPGAVFSAFVAAGKVTATAAVAALPVLALALTLGPVFCSWVCPWGFLSEGIDWLSVRVFRLHRPWRATGFRRLTLGRLALLGIFLLGSWVLAAPLVALLAPPRLLAALPQEVVYLGTAPRVTGALLLLWLFLELVLPRRFVCRALCPVGTLWNFLRTPKTLTVRFAPSLCVDPKVAPCHLHCPWGIDPRTMGTFDGCTNCLRCVEGCPSGALAVGFGRQGRARKKPGSSPSSRP
ncbi:MAG: 4Fe-4S binding protein [Thermoanaerobaculum sp.]